MQVAPATKEQVELLCKLVSADIEGSGSATAALEAAQAMHVSQLSGRMHL